MATQIPAHAPTVSSVPAFPLPGGGVGGEVNLVSGTPGPLMNAAQAEDELRSASEEPALRLSPSCARMPVVLAVTIPVREFRVRNLLAMQPGALLETQWGHGEDLPLTSGDIQLAWSEFEVIDMRLAVRVTRLA